MNHISGMRMRAVVMLAGSADPAACAAASADRATTEPCPLAYSRRKLAITLALQGTAGLLMMIGVAIIRVDATRATLAGTAD